MNFSSKAQTKETLVYVSEVQNLLQKIQEASGEAADAVNNFTIQSNSDKICILTVGNNFAQSLEYTLSNFQRVMIDNHKKGDDNKNLKEAIQEFSTFAHSIQLSFGNNVNKLQLEVINVLKNLRNKLNPLLDIVREHSKFTSKWEIADLLDYLYTAIEKVKMRIQWEVLDYKELQIEVENNVMKSKLAVLEILKNKEDLITYFRRYSHKAAEGILHVIEEINEDIYCYDDKIRDLALSVTNKISYATFEYEMAIHNNKSMYEFTLYAQLAAINIIGSLKEVLDILNNDNLQDSNGNIKNFVMNSVVNGLSCSVRFTRNWERILLQN